MSWVDILRKADARQAKSDVVGAFRDAFGALETCYTHSARERGWRPARGEDTFLFAMNWLLKEDVIPRADYDVSDHIRRARNVVLHDYGFEPSIGQVHRTIEDVRRLCTRFSATVEDVMAAPVISAAPEEPVGRFFDEMIRGVSYIPVLRDGRLIGTLTDYGVLDELKRGGGIVEPETPVSQLMEDKVMSSIRRDETIEDAFRKLRNSKIPALLVTQGPTILGIVTPFDLLRRFQI